MHFAADASARAYPACSLGPTPAAQTRPWPPVSLRGLYNWIHGTGDAERAFAFYHDVFGIALARSPFAGAPRRRRAAGDDPARVAGRLRSRWPGI